jgi:beta-glucosidase
MDKVYQFAPLVSAIAEEGAAEQVALFDGTNIDHAVLKARISDVVILFVQEWQSEGLDAIGLSLPDNQDALIHAVAAANRRTVVVIQPGRITMPWHEELGAILTAWYPGTGVAHAIARVLFGRVNSFGRLPVAFLASEAQLPRPAQIDPETLSTPRKGGAHGSSQRLTSTTSKWYASKVN